MLIIGSPAKYWLAYDTMMVADVLVPVLCQAIKRYQGLETFHMSSLLFVAFFYVNYDKIS